MEVRTSPDSLQLEWLANSAELFVARQAEMDAFDADVASDGADAHEASALVWVWPLVGVLHAAGVLRDRMLRAMSADDVHASFAPKAAGAALLHFAATRGLEAFGLFSSVASTFGNIGQANYAAGNASLDSFALGRSASGLAGGSLQLPLVKEVGMGSATFSIEQMAQLAARSRMG